MFQTDGIHKAQKISRERYLFRRFRGDVRWMMGPFFVLFSVVDFAYVPEKAPFWLALRLFFFAAVYSAVFFLKREFYRRRYSDTIAVIVTALSANIVNFMIWDSGGVDSLYVPGLFLVVTIGTLFLRLDQARAFWVAIFSYIPALAILMASAESGDETAVLVLSSFLVAFTFTSFITRIGENEAETGQTRKRVKLKEELERLRRTEFMKKHFPPQLRKRIESGHIVIPERQIIPAAVVGFVDITSSTRIANSVDLSTDWEFKEKFLEAATKRATECGLIVLTHLGDGILFIANYENADDWQPNVVTYFKHLISDFDNVKESMRMHIGQIETGLKCALASGPAALGFIGKDQSYFTAMGPDVNLAARLCSMASNNELIVTPRVWKSIRHLLAGWDAKAVKAEVRDFKEIGEIVRIQAPVKRGSIAA